MKTLLAPSGIQILILDGVKKRLDYYIQECDSEISGLGTVKQLSPNKFLITGLFLLEQEVTGTTTDLAAEDVSKMLVQIVRENMGNPKEIKAWWHSHASMNCFWSPTDHTTMRRFNNGFMIGIVGNKQGEYRCRLDIFEPLQLTIDELNLEVIAEEDPSLRQEVQAEIKAKVKKRKLSFLFSKGKDNSSREDTYEGVEIKERESSVTKAVRASQVGRAETQTASAEKPDIETTSKDGPSWAERFLGLGGSKGDEEDGA